MIPINHGLVSQYLKPTIFSILKIEKMSPEISLTVSVVSWFLKD